MRLEHRHPRAALHSSLRRNSRRLGFGGACAALIAAVALASLGASAAASEAGPVARATMSARPKGALTKKQVIALIRRYAGTGPQGPAGAPGTNAIAGPPTGAASGALSGTYPNPSLAAESVGTANFKPTAEAPNAALLGGVGPAGFLQSGASAGGDLSGTYPNPSIAAGVITAADVAAANKDGTAATPSLRTLGTGAQQAMAGNATPGGPPTGAAGGDLSGTYPNPSVATIAGHTPITNATSAGGALTGAYPSPTLNVSGGPCANGKALTNVSAAAALSCGTGVYSDASGNLAVAPSPFGALSSGSYNSALGNGALHANTTGSYNSALGNGALAANTTGTANSALGTYALATNTTGGDNTAVGYQANPGSGGSYNILLGQYAGYGYNTSESSNIDIGNRGTGGESNVVRIGTNGPGAAQQDKVFIAGDSANVGAQPAALINTTTGQLGINTSSRRFKTDIHPLGSALGRLMALRPVSFRYKRGDVEGPNPLEYGLIAEQVARLYPNLVAYGRDGKPLTVLYQELPALLLAQAQRQQIQIERQRLQNKALRAQNRHQQAQIDWLMRHARLH